MIAMHNKISFAALLTAAGLAFSLSAQAFTPPVPQVNAKSYILMDYHTGHVIAAENEHQAHGPASLAKIMTSYIIGKEIQDGHISREDQVPVSENAWARNFPGSSLMFIEAGTEVSVADLNKGIVISSGNDASVAMAEYIAGTEDAFASLMNAYADDLGMDNTYFVNAHGLPAPEQTTTAYDMALLAQALITDVPESYALHQEREFTYNDITQRNRNTLLWDRSLNVDGIKTGHTRESGYSLVTSAVENDTRLITVVMGTDSMNARAAESRKLLNYGFRNFATVTAYDAGEVLVTPRVWGGEVDEIELGVRDEVVLTLPRNRRQDLSADFELNRTLEAPLAVGEEVGTVYLSLDGEDIAQVPLVTLSDAPQGSWFKRLTDSVRQYFADE